MREGKGERGGVEGGMKGLGEVRDEGTKEGRHGEMKRREGERLKA